MRSIGLDRQSTDRTEEVGGDVELPADTAYMILKNPRRRSVLSYLEGTGRPTTLDTLAEHIAAAENDIDVQALSSSQRKRVYIGLYQAHLPKMDDAGVVDFDKHRGNVELRPEGESLLPYINLDPDHRTRPRLYLLAAGLSVATVAIASVQPVPIPGFSVIGLLPLLVVTAHSLLTD